MARPGITEEQTHEAADALVAEGTKPTVLLVRERIGGSYSTVKKYLDTWNITHAEEHIPDIPEMPETVTTAMWQTWAAAWRVAQEDISTERQALEAARQEMERERGELLQEITRLEGEFETAEDKVAGIKSELGAERQAHGETDAALNDLKIENARLEERLTGSDKHAEELRQQVETLQGKLIELATPPQASKRQSPKGS